MLLVFVRCTFSVSDIDATELKLLDVESVFSVGGDGSPFNAFSIKPNLWGKWLPNIPHHACMLAADCGSKFVGAMGGR